MCSCVVAVPSPSPLRACSARVRRCKVLICHSAYGSRMTLMVSRPALACPTRPTLPIPGHLFPGLATRAHVWHARSSAPAGSAYVVILSRSARVDVCPCVYDVPLFEVTYVTCPRACKYAYMFPHYRLKPRHGKCLCDWSCVTTDLKNHHHHVYICIRIRIYNIYIYTRWWPARPCRPH